MARSNYFELVVDPLGRPRPGVSVTINNHGAGAATIWTAEFGGSSSSGSVFTDSQGFVNVWLDGGRYDMTPSGAGAETQVFDAGPGGSSGIQGLPGVGANWCGQWLVGRTYAVGDGVVNNLVAYISNVAGNVGHTPVPPGDANWTILPQTLYGVPAGGILSGSFPNPTAPTVMTKDTVIVSVVDHGATGNGSDQTVAIQAALTAAGAFVGAAGPTGVYIPSGGYGVTATLNVPAGVSVFSTPMLNGGNAALYHNFNGNMFNLVGSAALKDLYLINNGSYTGAAIYHVTPTSTSIGFFQFERLVVTDFTSGRGWERDVYIDGTAGSLGVRSIFFNNCQFFGAYTTGETVVIKKGVHVYASSCEIVQAPQTSVVCGVKISDNFSEDICFSGCSVDGTFISDAAQLFYSGRIRQGRTITCNTGSDNNVFTGDVTRATFVNNGGKGNVVHGLLAWLALPTLQNSWTAAAGYATPGYTIDGTGLVRLRGYLTGGTQTAGTLLFTLPAGARPVNNEAPYGQYALTGAGAAVLAQITVASSGAVSLQTALTGAGAAFISLSGVAFSVS